MRNFLIVAAAVPLAACATEGNKMPAEGFRGVCVEGPGQAYLGYAATAQAGTDIMRETRSTEIRWAAPGQMMTMEMRPDRVTVHYGPDNRITQIVCG
jgi:hypothetical protein